MSITSQQRHKSPTEYSAPADYPLLHTHTPLAPDCSKPSFAVARTSHRSALHQQYARRRGSDQSPIGGLGSLEKNKESGSAQESADVYSEMSARFPMNPGAAESLGDSSLISIDETTLTPPMARCCVLWTRPGIPTMLDQSLGDLDELLKETRPRSDQFQRRYSARASTPRWRR